MIDKESELYARLRTAPPDAPTPDLFIACGHAPSQSAMQLHGVCIFCYRNRLGEVSRQRNALQASIDAAGTELPPVPKAWHGNADREWADYSALRQAAVIAIVKLRMRAEAAERNLRNVLDADRTFAVLRKQEDEIAKLERQLADARHQQHVTFVFAEKQKVEFVAEIARLRKSAVVCQKDGVRFGEYYWVSHETITGCEAELIPTKQKQYYEWFLAAIDAARGQP